MFGTARRASRRRYGGRRRKHVMIESCGNQRMAVIRQTHKEFVVTKVGERVCPCRSTVCGFLDDAVTCDVNGAVDGGCRPKGFRDRVVTERPEIPVRAGVNSGVLVQPKAARKKLGSCPGAGGEWNRCGRGRRFSPSNGITADPNAAKRRALACA